MLLPGLRSDITVTAAPRYQLAYPSTKIHAKLERLAKKDGTWSDQHDDWFQPEDVEEYLYVPGTLDEVRVVAKEIAADDALYGYVVIMELIPEYYAGIRLSDSSVEVETVEAD